jgi:hypothetical protein
VTPVSEEQHRALRVLAPVLPVDAYLAEGVAVALHLSHRSSRDLDVFTVTSDPQDVADALAEQASVKVTTRQEGTVYLEIGDVPTSVIRHRYPLLEVPETLAGAGVAVASLADLCHEDTSHCWPRRPA